MTFEGLHNQKIYAGEHQPQVTLAKNRKDRNQSASRKQGWAFIYSRCFQRVTFRKKP